LTSSPQTSLLFRLRKLSPHRAPLRLLSRKSLIFV
jgi:hypothetical protein